jgi:hypothetical protein
MRDGRRQLASSSVPGSNVWSAQAPHNLPNAGGVRRPVLELSREGGRVSW